MMVQETEEAKYIMEKWAWLAWSNWLAMAIDSGHGVNWKRHFFWSGYARADGNDESIIKLIQT